MQQHELEELRKLLSDIAGDAESAEKASKDAAHAELCISSANMRMEKARARIKELTGADRDEIDLMMRLVQHAEGYGRNHR